MLLPKPIGIPRDREPTVDSKPTIKVLLVPSTIIEDIKFCNLKLEDLLHYDKVKSVLSESALKFLVAINSPKHTFKMNPLVNLDGTYSSSLTVPTFEQLAPIVNEVLDVKDEWIINATSEDEKELVINKFVESSSDDAEYILGTGVYDIELKAMIELCMSSISSVPSLLDSPSYEWVLPSTDGSILFVIMPSEATMKFDSNNIDVNTIKCYRNRILGQLIRKASIHYSDEEIYLSNLFSLYLSLLQSGKR